MGKEFIKPDFAMGDIELRYEESEIAIYATDNGLRKLISFCEMLIENPKQGHIHLEDYEVLTANSLKGTLTINLSK